MAIMVEDGTEQGLQRITLSTDMPGKLLLHWGVEGGEGYKAGWRLPGEASWPEGTVKYKDRALQTPFRQLGERSELTIVLKGGECSDYIDFVVKDTSIDRWFDFNGDNFRVRLHEMAPAAPGKDALKTMDEQDIPQLPQELCGIWAYIKWELAGCPERSQHDADSEYQQAIEELKGLLQMSIPLDEIWRVARGEGTRYQDWITSKVTAASTGTAVAPPPPTAAAAPAAPPAPAPAAPSPAVVVPEVPEDLIGVMAYIMWEKAGKPDGADFGNQAREQLTRELQGGKSIQDLRKELAAPPPPPPRAKPAVVAPQVAPPAPAALPRPAEIGPRVLDRTSTIFRAPLEFIKSDRPLLAQEKKESKIKPLTPLANAAAADKDVVWQRTYPLGQQAELLVVVQKDGQHATRIVLTTDIQDLVVLHWGVKKSAKADWILPPTGIVPAHSEAHPGGIAVETPFGDCKDEECDVEFLGSKVPLQRVIMHVPEGLDVSALTFVLRSEDSTMWWRDGGSNFTVPMPGGKQAASADPLAAFSEPLARAIVDAEVNSSMWTLMHRCNKASDVLNEVLQGYYDDVTNSMAMIYVWLRYSALRQLTWQRNYNTQPRILGAAQERLTHAIAHAYSLTGGEAQEWVRYMLTTVGRGGNAQAVRDEILNIMHRNKIPERAGTWMEQWHQKLHNNTTPDDVVICEAYLAFLYEGGNQEAYWRVLKQGGVTRERLASFERAITVDPEYFPDKQQALIRDCTHYLGILKACHSGAELQSSAAAAGPFLPDAAKGFLGYVLANQGHHEILPLIQNAVECRGKLSKVIHDGNREILYLDLALESLVRSAAERGASAFGMGAAPLVAPLLANLILSVGDNEELCYCLKAWEELPDYCINGANPSQEDALRMLAVVDRIRRALAATSDKVSRRIEPISTALGRAFGVEEWSVDIFAEEVVRAGPAFAVSLVLSSLEQPVRAAANLSSWQVISPGNVSGKLVIVDGLHEVQDKSYSEPTILFAKRITGEEEVPDGVVGLVGSDAPDVLAHLSVRARNMHVLFAACYDETPLAELAAMAGKAVNIATTAGGDVRWSEGSAADMGDVKMMANPLGERKKIKVTVPKWNGKWAVGMDAFGDGVVGAKSKNLAGLRGRLPDWIALPASVTLPFGCFEEVLRANGQNKKIEKELNALVKTVNLQNADAVLTKARALAMQVEVPDRVIEDLGRGMADAGIIVPGSPERWQQALAALKGVWASKFNERAYISMRKVGLDFMDIRMAVLCQRVVPAKYAYVIHTRNPTNGDDSEVYCELVMGLGEAIVSGMVPGSALAFVAKKDALDKPRVVLFPSKGEGMYVKDSLIFRSDSNGEDLEGYAGAGLYDSITVDPTVLKRVDYNEDPIIKDEAYRVRIMSAICKVGAAIEEALGSAQDVEGVVDPDDNVTVVQTRPQM